MFQTALDVARRRRRRLLSPTPEEKKNICPDLKLINAALRPGFFTTRRRKHTKKLAERTRANQAIHLDCRRLRRRIFFGLGLSFFFFFFFFFFIRGKKEPPTTQRSFSSSLEKNSHFFQASRSTFRIRTDPFLPPWTVTRLQLSLHVRQREEDGFGSGSCGPRKSLREERLGQQIEEASFLLLLSFSFCRLSQFFYKASSLPPPLPPPKLSPAPQTQWPSPRKLPPRRSSR